MVKLGLGDVRSCSYRGSASQFILFISLLKKREEKECFFKKNDKSFTTLKCSLQKLPVGVERGKLRKAAFLLEL